MGFVILNSGNETVSDNALIFIKFFGAYMTLYGLANLIYGVHNHDQANDLKEERSIAAKKGAKKLAAIAKTPAKKAVKKPVAKKTTAKKPVAKKTAKKTTRKK
jgi:topoisomerase IA-like protein